MPGEDEGISRVWRSHREAQATYDRISRWYDRLEGNWEKKPRELALDHLHVCEGERVLEIGFGTGQSLLNLAQAVGTTGRVFGIDLSPRMVEIARARVHKAGLGDRVELDSGDAIRLAFDDSTFDAIFMSFVLELFDTPEIPLVLSECRRVLKPGGRACIAALTKAGGVSRMRDLYEWGHAKFPNVLDCRPIQVARALKVAGFSVISGTRISLWGLPVEIVLAERSPQRVTVPSTNP